MKRNLLRLILSCLTYVALYLGFYGYGGIRTMDDTIGFQLASCAKGILWGVGFGFFSVAPFAMMATMVLKQNILIAYRFFLVLCLVLLVNCGFSEVLLLKDEVAFAAEATTHTESYMRDRAWPNESSQLVYELGKGMRSTD